MKPPSNRFQPTAAPPESIWAFSKILHATPPTLGEEIALTTVQLAPIHEFAPGHFEAPIGFTMNVGGVTNYKFNNQQKGEIIMIDTNTTFSPEEIAQAAQRNAHLFCFTNVVCAKAHGLSPNEYWTFMGRQYATLWEQGQSVPAIARRAARNMVSVGATLQALSADDSQAEAVMTGWPAPDTTAHFGLTQAEADAVFDIFAPIAASLDCCYHWRRRGDTIVMNFAR